MIDLGYAAVVFPQSVFIFSEATDEILAIDRREDGDAAVNKLIEFVETDTPIERIRHFFDTEITIRDV